MAKTPNEISAKLAIGPMSSETIEATYRFSHNHNTQLMLIASRNQIDFNGGYVNNWKTDQYVDFLNNMKKKYPTADILICRDHCGPGFRSETENDLSNTYKTIENDLACDFDMIHVDLCHYQVEREIKLKESINCIEYIRKIKSDILIEVGTDENTGDTDLPLEQIEKEINMFAVYEPYFYVSQTGSLVKENYQAGQFNESIVKKIANLIHQKGLKFKEHNADYLNQYGIAQRKGIIDAMNIAPMFGVIQTACILELCLIYGINTHDFLNRSYESRKWVKWLSKNTADNKYLCSLIAGHYNFTSNEYMEIVDNLEKYTPVSDVIIDKMMETIHRYCYE